jgi:hypothetical protein
VNSQRSGTAETPGRSAAAVSLYRSPSQPGVGSRRTIPEAYRRTSPASVRGDSSRICALTCASRRPRHAGHTAAVSWGLAGPLLCLWLRVALNQYLAARFVYAVVHVTVSDAALLHDRPGLTVRSYGYITIAEGALISAQYIQHLTSSANHHQHYPPTPKAQSSLQSSEILNYNSAKMKYTFALLTALTLAAAASTGSGFTSVTASTVVSGGATTNASTKHTSTHMTTHTASSGTAASSSGTHTTSHRSSSSASASAARTGAADTLGMNSGAVGIAVMGVLGQFL